MARRAAIAIPQHDSDILRELYREYRIPTDQYRQREDELQRFVDSWNMLSNRTDSTAEVLHYMVTQRKAGRWVTFKGTHKRLDALPQDFLSGGQWMALRRIYEEMFISKDMGSDNLAFDEALSGSLAREFFDRTKTSVAGCLLYAAIMQKRKRHEWPTIRPAHRNNSVERPLRPFGDIDKLAS